VTGRRFPLWTALGVVLIVALVLGDVLNSSPPGPAQRAAAIESVVRCPSCEDLSVAQSTAPTAVAVRAAVTQLIAEGRTDQQIRDYLVDRYGASIELDPPASGWSLLVWLLPLLAGLTGATALAVVFVRRRHLAGDGPDTRHRGMATPLTPEAADERRQFLTRSLADADAEYLAGDLSDQDYLALRQRDLVRLAALDAPVIGGSSAGGAPVSEPAAAGPVSAEPGVSPSTVVVDDRAPATDEPDAGVPSDDGRHPQSPPRRRSRSRRSSWFLGGAVLSFAAALVVAVSLFASDRQPGQAATGSFAQSQTQQIEETLDQAAGDENQGQVGEAAQLYQTVLDRHPENEVALAQLGWLEYQTGVQGSSATLINDARRKLTAAVGLDPGDYAARLYLGTLLFQRDGDAAGAVSQYGQFLADHPPAALVAQAAPEVRAAYQKAGAALPSQVTAG
jgi:cytochrome c-type biogenesis protein CcmH